MIGLHVRLKDDYNIITQYNIRRMLFVPHVVEVYAWQVLLDPMRTTQLFVSVCRIPERWYILYVRYLHG